MAKRKKSTDKRRGEAPTFMDPRVEDLEAILDKLGEALGFNKTEDHTPMGRAVKLLMQVPGAPQQRQVKLARQALEIYPDCAEAYVILARNSESLDESLQLLRKAVAAGQRAVQTETAAKDAFSAMLAEQICVRTRAELAECLCAAGRLAEAAAEFETLLQLDPEDERGVRYFLATMLLELDRDDDLRRLLNQYKTEKSATWAYTRVLLSLRTSGPSADAAALLKKAAKANRHVPAYLLGDKPLPDEIPDLVGPGRVDEAIVYADANRRVWLNTPGAISWLREALGVGLPTRPGPRRPAWPQRKLKLLQLPCEPGEVWQFEVLPAPLPGGAEPPPWAMMILEPESHEVMGMDVRESEPRPKEIIDYLLDVMAVPLRGSPRRPETVQVRDGNVQAACAAKLQQIDVDCAVVETMEPFLDTMREQLVGLAHRVAGDASPDEPSSAEDLRALPLEPDEVWQADIRPFPGWIDGEGKPYRPWLGLVTSRTSDLVLAHELTPDRPASDWLWQAIVRAMQHPNAAAPMRPGTMEVWSIEHRDALQPRLRELGIECVVAERLAHLDAMMEDMARHMEGVKRQPTLLDAPGVQPATLASYYAAAASFYRAMPWRRVPGDTIIEIRGDRWQSGPRYGVVMGQSGVQQGLAVYEDLASLQAIIRGGQSDAESVRGMSAISLMYGEAFEIPARELDAVERHHWPIAGPEAYPLLLRITPGGAMRAPLVWEIEMMTSCLRLLPDFLAQRQSPWTKTIAAASGETNFRLAWVQ